MIDPSDITFNDLLALSSVIQNDPQLLKAIDNDCDCVAYGSTIIRVPLDSEEITRVAGQKD